jgi:hypothetical protein
MTATSSEFDADLERKDEGARSLQLLSTNALSSLTVAGNLTCQNELTRVPRLNTTDADNQNRNTTSSFYLHGPRLAAAQQLKKGARG